MPTELKLNDHKKTEALKVDIGGKTYSIPLGSSLSVKEYRKLKKIGNDEEGMFDFLAGYLGKDVVEELSLGDITTIFQAWTKATQEASGLTPGES